MQRCSGPLGALILILDSCTAFQYTSEAGSALCTPSRRPPLFSSSLPSTLDSRSFLSSRLLLREAVSSTLVASLFFFSIVQANPTTQRNGSFAFLQREKGLLFCFQVLSSFLNITALLLQTHAEICRGVVSRKNFLQYNRITRQSGRMPRQFLPLAFCLLPSTAGPKRYV